MGSDPMLQLAQLGTTGDSPQLCGYESARAAARCRQLGTVPNCANCVALSHTAQTPWRQNESRELGTASRTYSIALKFRSAFPECFAAEQGGCLVGD